MRSPRTGLLSALLPLLILVGACTTTNQADRGEPRHSAEELAWAEICDELCERARDLREGPCSEQPQLEAVFPECGDFLQAHAALVDDLEIAVPEKGLEFRLRTTEAIERLREGVDDYESLGCAAPTEGETTDPGSSTGQTEADDAVPPPGGGGAAGILPFPIPTPSVPEQQPSTAPAPDRATAEPSDTRSPSERLEENSSQIQLVGRCTRSIYEVNLAAMDIAWTFDPEIP
ncbi:MULTISPECIES: hypothetical protein [Actinoalloteichus]|uniref:Uncharacterized protein n=1 Tax=Actinoalloteichus fjordicus TaxID=1612552 RepID=A0AAC9PQC4_9PSEU|nr:MULTISPECIES: hypothetical protein [Actinoalloteichus]APU12964.1 hypothetical protein UA74_04425 [Actinoalloteichus fjordicus]APU18935.1 hypothetical protein UA75_04530 [Actinoalloteichus sp. GBA129-24]